MVQLERILKKLALILFRALTSTLWTHCFRPRLSRILNIVARVEAILRGPALIIFGALASIIATLYFQRLLSTTWLAVTALLASFFALWGMGVVALFPTLQRKMRKGKRIPFYLPPVVETQRQITLIAPRVGILRDMEWEEQNHLTHTGTNVTPEEWREAIETKAGEENLNLKVRTLSVKANFAPYLVVLNPYGGVYPETDLKDFTTLNQIFTYVKNGGLFVNVADIPGFWAFNPLLKRKLHATPPIYGVTISEEEKKEDGFEAKEGRRRGNEIRVTEVRSFLRTPFVEKLGLRVTNTEGTDCFNWDIEFAAPYDKVAAPKPTMTVHRAVETEFFGEPTVKALVKPRIGTPFGKNTKLTPLFLADFGEGRFLISLIFQSHLGNAGMKEILVEIVNRLVKEALAVR